MFIQNVSRRDIAQGDHFDCGDRAVLIQIGDPCSDFPVPRHNFEKVYQFEFLDTDDTSDDFACTSFHAAELVKILQEALNEHRNVIVHCHAGICRSGAIAEVGIMLGFQDTGAFRLPNTLVERLMVNELGGSYNAAID